MVTRKTKGQAHCLTGKKNYIINTVNSTGVETCARSRKRTYYTLFQLDTLMSAGPNKVYFTVLKNWLKPQGLSNDYLQELMEDEQGPQEGQTQYLCQTTRAVGIAK